MEDLYRWLQENSIKVAHAVLVINADIPKYHHCDTFITAYRNMSITTSIDSSDPLIWYNNTYRYVWFGTRGISQTSLNKWANKFCEKCYQISNWIFQICAVGGINLVQKFAGENFISSGKWVEIWIWLSIYKCLVWLSQMLHLTTYITSVAPFSATTT